MIFYTISQSIGGTGVSPVQAQAKACGCHELLIDCNSVLKGIEEFPMIRTLVRALLMSGVVASSLACAAKRPVLYPNARLQAVGAVAAQQDIDDCLQKAVAEGYSADAGGKVAGSTAVGAATGAAVGAAMGAVAGRAGAGAAMGGAGGGTSGLIRGLGRSRDLNPVQQRFVDQCLKDKGYEVIGWQ
jgi:outer membrane lipoprotein SlyB